MSMRERMGSMDMKWTWIRGGVALLVAGTLAGCGGAAQADGVDGSPGAEEFARVINVEVQDVAPMSFVEEIRLTAAAQANQDVRVSAEESGVVTAILVDRGSRVREGQALIKIDDRVLSAQVDQARAQAELATHTWERRKRLYEEDQVGSEILYLEAKFAAEQTQANLRVLEERLARTTVRAPFAGVLESRDVEVGTMVSPGTPVLRIVDLDPIKVMGGVPERYAADVAVGETATITFDVLTDRTFEATVTYVGSTVEPRSRTFPVEVRVPNRDGLIKPEMVAGMSLVRERLEDVVVVPQDALVRVENGYVVFAAVERGGVMVAEVRPLEVGPAQRDLVVVDSGIAPGEKLIVVGQKSVADGDRINVVGTRN